MNDLKFALRQLLKNPGFTAVAVLTLALGIGPNIAIFSIVDNVLLKPLPYDEPGQLVQIWEAAVPGNRDHVSPGAFLDWREHNPVFENLALQQDTSMNLTGAGEPEQINGIAMSASGLEILRVQPFLGRIFAFDEDQPGNDKVVVLTHGFWQRRFGGDTNIVGRGIQLNDESYAVIGVLPPRVLPRKNEEFVIPRPLAPGDANQRNVHRFEVIGRLKPGVTIERAQAEMNGLVARLKPLYPAHKKDWGITLVPMHEQITGNIKPALLILVGAVGLVLLIACANVANLLLARATARQKEIAIRNALGATRSRIVRQLITESGLLSFLGALLGLLLAFWSVGALPHLTTLELPRGQEVGLDWRVLGFATLISVVAGIVFGVAPALQTSRPNLNEIIKEGSAASGVGRRFRLRGSLIIAEVALSLVLLVGASLLLRSFVRLLNVPPGINPENLLTMQVTLSGKKYPDAERRASFFEQALERIGDLPGVKAAGAIQTLPLEGYPFRTTFVVAGRQGQPAEGYFADSDRCTPDYFRAMAIPLLKGRFFDERNRAGTRRVLIINEALAREHFPNEDPIGKQVRLNVFFTGGIDEGWEIVGVVGDVRQRGLGEKVRPCVYRPLAQVPPGGGYLVIRTISSPLAMAETVRKTILGIDSNQPVANVRTMKNVIAGSVAQRRFILMLLSGFAGSALFLAAIGMYGVISFLVSQRTREIGIRLALGARRIDVLALLLRQGMQLVGIGVALGAACALGLTRFLASLLFEVKPTDPLAFIGVSTVLVLVAFLASFVPARRAAKVDPMEALRYE